MQEKWWFWRSEVGGIEKKSFGTEETSWTRETEVDSSRRHFKGNSEISVSTLLVLINNTIRSLKIKRKG